MTSCLADRPYATVWWLSVVCIVCIVAKRWVLPKTVRRSK